LLAVQMSDSVTLAIFVKYFFKRYVIFLNHLAVLSATMAKCINGDCVTDMILNAAAETSRDLRQRNIESYRTE